MASWCVPHVPGGSHIYVSRARDVDNLTPWHMWHTCCFYSVFSVDDLQAVEAADRVSVATTHAATAKHGSPGSAQTISEFRDARGTGLPKPSMKRIAWRN